MSSVSSDASGRRKDFRTARAGTFGTTDDKTSGQRQTCDGVTVPGLGPMPSHVVPRLNPPGPAHLASGAMAERWRPIPRACVAMGDAGVMLLRDGDWSLFGEGRFLRRPTAADGMR